MKRKGFVFTLDAILAIVLVLIFVTSIAAVQSQTGNVYSTYSRAQDKYTAENVLRVLRTTPLEDLVPAPVISKWIDEGIINMSVVNPAMTPIDIVATYWATGPIYNQSKWRHNAEVILGYLLNNTLKGYDYELFINNYTSPYLRKLGANPNITREISPATLVISGYAYNQTPRGYMARAYLTKVSHTYSRLIGIQRVTAGGCYYYYGYRANDFEAYYNFTLPDDMRLLYADARFAKRSAYDSMDVYLNGNLIQSSPAGSFSSPLIPNSTLSRYLRRGNNTLHFVESAYCYYPQYTEEGFGSGSTMLVEYLTNSTSTQDPNTVYLYDIDSKHTGFVHFVTLIPTGNVTAINLHLKVSGVSMVRLYYQFGANVYSLINITPVNGIVDVTSSQIAAALSRYGITYSNLSQHSFTLAIGFDAKYGPNEGRWLYAGQNYDTRAINERHVYGFGQSWVKVSVIPRILQSMYSIPMSIPLGYSDFTYTLWNGYGPHEAYVSYYLPSYATPWYADYWVAIQYSSGANFNNKLLFWENYVSNGTIYYGNLDLYLYRFGYSRFKDSLMIPGQTNTFYMRSYDPYYIFRYDQTRGIVYYFIQAFAGYGNVFPYLLQGYPNYGGYNLTYWYSEGGTTKSATVLVGNPPYKRIDVSSLDPLRYAVDDAILRLFDKLNYKGDKNPDEWNVEPYDGSQENPIDMFLSGGLRIETASMGNVPNLYPPITITLRVWREK
ncbi:TPM domain-containing protein [Thermococcus sp.]